MREGVFGSGEGGHAGGRSEGRCRVSRTCMENPLQESRKKKEEKLCNDFNGAGFHGVLIYLD